MVEVRGYVKRPSLELHLRRGFSRLTCVICENCSIRYTSLNSQIWQMARRRQFRWRPKLLRVRPSGNGGLGADRGRTCTSRSEIVALTLSSSSERLDYIADMVQELRILSAQADYRALAGILELAYHEALRRRRAGE